MTTYQKELFKTRINWTVDKALLGAVCYFVVRTYNTIDLLVTKVQVLETQVAVMQSAIRILKLDL